MFWQIGIGLREGLQHLFLIISPPRTLLSMDAFVSSKTPPFDPFMALETPPAHLCREHP